MGQLPDRSGHEKEREREIGPLRDHDSSRSSVSEQPIEDVVSRVVVADGAVHVPIRGRWCHRDRFPSSGLDETINDHVGATVCATLSQFRMVDVSADAAD
jgi:hypothetical protein